MKNKPFNTVLSAEVISALHRGNKIEAIKLLREEQGIGLKEAKDAVDAYVRTQPDLAAIFAAAQSRTSRSVLLWLLILIGGAILFYIFSSRQ